MDSRLAVRRIVHHPTASIAAALTLALGVGASTAVFSVVHAVLLRPLPFAAPERTAIIGERAHGSVSDLASPLAYIEWRESARSFHEVASAVWWEGSNLETAASQKPSPA